LKAGLSPAKGCPSKRGRPPFPELLIFRIVVLKHFYQLSDDEMAFQLYDRLIFRNFVGLRESDRVPDSKIIWLLKNGLASSGVLLDLFAAFGAHLEVLAYWDQKGQLIDASIQEVQEPRSLAPETEAFKAEHDTDGTFTKKGFGYKNHVSIDERFGFVRRYGVSETSLQVFEDVFDESRTVSNLYADSPYRGGSIEGFVEEKFLTDKGQHRAYRRKPLNGHQKHHFFV